MTESHLRLAELPANTRAAFEELARQLERHAGPNLLALTAFGGWLAEDPLFAGTPASSVAVLDHFDLGMLDGLAREGTRLGRRGLRAPLIMTPSYIAASCDVFPLELLEIQQLHVTLLGDDHFATLSFKSADLRLQCERELKSQLISLRQGLLSAAGRRKPLEALCRGELERLMRVLRGLLQLAGVSPARQSAELVTQLAQHAGLELAGLKRLLAHFRSPNFERFQAFYQDLSTLAEYADKLGSGPDAT